LNWFASHSSNRIHGAVAKENTLAESAEKMQDCTMSTVIEIEAAIEKLAPADYRKLLVWIEEHQAMVGASESLFATYDEEEQADAKGQSR
jgi:hypothetical protein